MLKPEEIQRPEALRSESYRSGPLRADLSGASEPEMPANGHDPAAKAVGSPLPTGTSSRTQDAARHVPPPGRSLTGAEENPGVQKAMSVLKQAMPFVQSLLPLLDGKMAGAMANLLSMRHAAPPSVSVDIAPVKSQISDLQLQHSDLRTQVIEQNSSLKRVEDRLEMVREATDRNTLEQQELIEDLKAVGNKVNLFALLLFAMLIVSLLLNLALFLHIKQVLP